jgi:hypothetical protein
LQLPRSSKDSRFHPAKGSEHCSPAFREDLICLFFFVLFLLKEEDLFIRMWPLSHSRGARWTCRR